MKRASLYVLKKNIVLYSLSVGNSSWRASKPFYKLPIGYNSELVEAIKDVLAHSEENVVFERGYSPAKTLKETIGLTFSKLQGIDTKLISLSQEANKITFSPNKIIGPNKGFKPLEKAPISISESSTEKEILDALQETVLCCE